MFNELILSTLRAWESSTAFYVIVAMILVRIGFDSLIGVLIVGGFIAWALSQV